jgi:hypothetical protein|tara:strand:- start:277 stop:678 length:402 start_codon:yes stop_codon:yes gene_type:complete
MKVTHGQLRRIIREAIIREAEFYDETPEGQLVGTAAEDARFAQQLDAEKVMTRAGLTKPEMSQMWGWIKSGDPDMEFYNSTAYEKLFGLLAFDEGQMPYGIAKCRTGEPDIWILDYLSGEEQSCWISPSQAAK